jgi:hypothetical protein
VPLAMGHNTMPGTDPTAAKMYGVAGAASLGAACGLPWVQEDLGVLPAIVLALAMVCAFHLGWARIESERPLDPWAVTLGWAALGALVVIPVGLEGSYTWFDYRFSQCFSLSGEESAGYFSFLLSALQGFLFFGCGIGVLQWRGRWWKRVRRDLDASERLCLRAAFWCVLASLAWSGSNEGRGLYWFLIPLGGAYIRARDRCGTQVAGVAIVGYIVAACASMSALRLGWRRWCALPSLLHGTHPEWELVRDRQPVLGDQTLVRGDGVGGGGVFRHHRLPDAPERWVALRRRARDNASDPYRGASDDHVFFLSEGARWARRLTAMRVGLAAACLLACVALLAAQTARAVFLTIRDESGSFEICKCNQEAHPVHFHTY